MYDSDVSDEEVITRYLLASCYGNSFVRRNPVFDKMTSCMALIHSAKRIDKIIQRWILKIRALLLSPYQPSKIEP